MAKYCVNSSSLHISTLAISAVLAVVTVRAVTWSVPLFAAKVNWSIYWIVPGSTVASGGLVPLPIEVVGAADGWGVIVAPVDSQPNLS